MSRRRLHRRLYRLLLHVYPPRFRRLYAADMVAYFERREDELVVRGRSLGSIALWGEILVDMVFSVPRQWILSIAPVLASFAGDMRRAARGLIQRPGFSLSVIGTLALAIGANAAVFSLVKGVLITPLPYHEPDRLVRIYQQNSPTNRWSLSVADWIGIQEQHETFASVAAVRRTALTATGGERPERLRVGAVTSGFLDTFGVRMATGRGFREGEDEAGAEAVVVLSHAFAERYLGSTRDAVGRDVTLDGTPYQVIGVLASEVGAVAGLQADVWVPAQLAEPERRGPFFLAAFGRLAEGRTIDQASAELEAVSRRIFPIWQAGFADENATLTPFSLRDDLIGDADRWLGLVSAAVALVLAVAIANAANLMLTRVSGRRQELSVRAALGATPGRLASVVVAEGLLLALVGGAAGLAIAVGSVEAFRQMSFPVPRLAEVGVDVSVVAFAFAVVLTATLAMAGAQLWFGAARSSSRDLRGAGRSASAGRKVRWFRSSLVVLEFALTVPLMVAAGLLLNSLVRLQAVDPGFAPGGLVAGSLSLPAQTYPESEQVTVFWDRFEAAVRELPGVARMGYSTNLPPDLFGNSNNFDLLDKPVPPGESQPVSPWTRATTDFFETLGMPLIEGRLFVGGDGAEDALPVVVVSRAWAERFFPDESAVGKQFVNGGCYTCEPTTIVGVVGDVKYDGLASHSEVVFEVAVPRLSRSMSFAVRTDAPSSTTLAAIAETVRELDPDLPINGLGTMDERLSAAVAQPRQWANLIGAFAVAAALLAAVGVFGVMSYFVRQQVREIGVRKALGADQRSVMLLVVGRGMTLVGSGLAAGLALSAYSAQWLDEFLFDVSATDPATVGGICALLALIAFGACYLPGRKAARIDPVEAMISE